MTLTKAFVDTTVRFDKSMADIEKLLQTHAIRESRFTHLRPQREPRSEYDKAEDTQGSVVYEFVRGRDDDRRGVRVTVRYQPQIGIRGGKAGTTAEMAARALYWFLKAKFDAIDYGIEEFDVAFMPHLLTALGTTFAEQPLLIAEVIHRPESVLAIAPSTVRALPAPGANRGD